VVAIIWLKNGSSRPSSLHNYPLAPDHKDCSVKAQLSMAGEVDRYAAPQLSVVKKHNKSKLKPSIIRSGFK
jgi:hypothetical protein